jgi:hypothetical protein
VKAGRAVLLAWGAFGAACRNFGEPVPRLAATPPSLTFAGVAGGTAPPPQALTVDAIGGGQLPWAASADVPWVSVSPASGTAPIVAWVAADVAGLQAGSYAGRIIVTTTSGAGEGMQATVPVTLALTSAVSLSGRWAGGKDTVTIALTITQVDTGLTGSGTLNPPLRTVRVVGSYRDPAVRLILTASDSSVTTFTGSLVDDNAMLGVLNGGGLSNFQLTIFRQ